MKKVFFALALVATLGMVGCSKDEEKETNNDNQQKNIDWGIADDLFGKSKTEAQEVLAQAGYDSIDFKRNEYYYLLTGKDDTVRFECNQNQIVEAVDYRYLVDGDIVKPFFVTKKQQGLGEKFTYNNNTCSFDNYSYFVNADEESDTLYSAFESMINQTDNVRCIIAHWASNEVYITLHTERYGDNAQNYKTHVGIGFSILN